MRVRVLLETRSGDYEVTREGPETLGVGAANERTAIRLLDEAVASIKRGVGLSPESTDSREWGRRGDQTCGGCRDLGPHTYNDACQYSKSTDSGASDG